MTDKEDVIGGWNPRRYLGLEGGEPARRNQGTRRLAPLVRHVAEEQAGTRTASGREPAGEGALGGGQDRDSESVGPTEHLGWISGC